MYHQVQRNIKINTSRAMKGSTKIVRLGDIAITPDPGWGRLEALLLILDIPLGPVGSMTSPNSLAASGYNYLCDIYSIMNVMQWCHAT